MTTEKLINCFLKLFAGKFKYMFTFLNEQITLKVVDCTVSDVLYGGGGVYHNTF